MFIKYKDEFDTTTLINLDKVEFMQCESDKDGYTLVIETTSHTYTLFGELVAEEAQSLMEYIEDNIIAPRSNIIDLYYWARN